MKTRLAVLKLFTMFLVALATSGVLAQTIYYWTGAGDGYRLDNANNWDPVGTPSPGGDYGDILIWDGRTTTNLALTFTTTAMQGWSGGIDRGLDVWLTSNQTNSVTFYGSVGLSAAIRMDDFQIDEGAGAFTLGAAVTPLFDLLMGGTNSQTHQFINNSSNPATINPAVRLRHGGGGAHVYEFSGAGSWFVNHHLRTANNSPVVITKSGPGTMVWTRYDVAPYDSVIQGPLTINEGTLVLKSHNLIHDMTSPRTINNYGVLEYDAATGEGVILAAINGNGALKISSGWLTLSGQNAFSGDVILAGGTLILGSAENPGVSGPLGVGGTIVFNGGTLQFSGVNAYDYSARFSAEPGQQYRIHTGGQNVTFATGLSSSGGSLTKLGSGTLNLTGTSSFTGSTFVNEGKLVFVGPKTGTGGISVADGAVLGVTETDTQLTPASLTLGSSSGAVLEFNNVSSTARPIIAAGTLSGAGTVTVNINSGAFVGGQSYPLLSWSGGTPPTFVLGSLAGAVGSLSVVGNTLYLNITGLAYVWTGANNGIWDTSTPNNWVVGGAPAIFANGGAALFDDTATGTTDVILGSVVQPVMVTVNNITKTYTITSSSSAYIDGSAGLAKSGAGSLTISGGANRYTGPTVINGGVLSVSTLANGGVPSDIGAATSDAANLVLNGGTLQYTGTGANINRLFSLGTGGGTIEAAGAGVLVLNNTGSIGLIGSGSRLLVLAGASADDNLLAASIGDGGGPTALTKAGAGKWILTGDNTYSGATTISGGILQVGNGGNSGSLGTGNVLNNGGLVFNRMGSVTVPGTITGTGWLLNEGPGAVVLLGDNTYSGGTTNNGVLQLGNGGNTGRLNSSSPIENNGLLIYDTDGLMTLAGGGVIAGSGNLIVRKGWLMAIGANSYTGWTLIEPGATFQPCRGNAGQLLSSVVTNNGTLWLVRQDGMWPEAPVFVYGGNIVGTGAVFKDVNNFNPGSVGLTGTNNYTGGTFIGGGGLVLGDNATPGAGAIVGDVIFTNSLEYDNGDRYLVFNRPDDFVFSGNIISVVAGDSVAANFRGRVIQAGAGMVTLTGNNTYPSGTTINASCALQVGNGGTTGTLGTGNIANDGALIFNRADDVVVNSVISGSGSVVKKGAGRLVLNATNTYTGDTLVSNGTLVVNGVLNSSTIVVGSGATLAGNGELNSYVVLDPGSTLAPGTSIGTMTLNGGMNIAGDIVIEVDKSQAQSNDVVVVNGWVSVTGTGTLQVVNLGPTLAVGDKFMVFTQPVPNGSALTITGGNATWINNLEVDGSIEVSSVLAPPVLNYTQVGNTLQFSWTGNYKLQAQTNTLSVGISTNWYDYPGGGTSPVTVPINPSNGAVFFRLVSK